VSVVTWICSVGKTCVVDWNYYYYYYYYYDNDVLVCVLGIVLYGDCVMDFAVVNVVEKLVLLSPSAVERQKRIDPFLVAVEIPRCGREDVLLLVFGRPNTSMAH
jgi:hypothetical protein